MPETTHERSVRTLAGKYRSFFAATVVAVLLLQVTVVSDAAIVGNLLGAQAMASVRVATPIIILLAVLSTLLGVGGSTQIAIAMGKRQAERADRLFTMTCLACIVSGIVFAAVVAPMAGSIAHLISTAPESEPYTATFLRYVALGAPAYILAGASATLLRTDGHVGSPLWSLPPRALPTSASSCSSWGSSASESRGRPTPPTAACSWPWS